jgi:hypothetical protein
MLPVALGFALGRAHKRVRIVEISTANKALPDHWGFFRQDAAQARKRVGDGAGCSRDEHSSIGVAIGGARHKADFATRGLGDRVNVAGVPYAIARRQDARRKRRSTRRDYFDRLLIAPEAARLPVEVQAVVIAPKLNLPTSGVIGASVTPCYPSRVIGFLVRAVSLRAVITC